MLLSQPPHHPRLSIAWDQARQWGKKARGQIGKISASEASRAVSWGGKGRPPPFPLSRLPLGSLRSPIFFFRLRRFFFVLFPQCGTWSQASLIRTSTTRAEREKKAGFAHDPHCRSQMIPRAKSERLGVKLLDHRLKVIITTKSYQLFVHTMFLSSFTRLGYFLPLFFFGYC